jgi:uncharacterized protein (DUF1499 family)
MLKILLYIAGSIVVLGLFMFVILSVAAQEDTVAKGLSEDGLVFPCGSKPNCISTTETRDDFKVEPLKLAPGVILDDIVKVIIANDSPEILDRQENYVSMVYRTLIFKFPDDIEMTAKDGQLLVRSQSRAGESDVGKNRKRFERIKNLLIENKLVDS